eukprot:COSAG04_NODE_542_length_12865_cov_44.119693_7_plen_61_part_00
MAERIVARNGHGGAVLREIMRLDTRFWAQGVGGFQKRGLLPKSSIFTHHYFMGGLSRTWC